MINMSSNRRASKDAPPTATLRIIIGTSLLAGVALTLGAGRAEAATLPCPLQYGEVGVSSEITSIGGGDMASSMCRSDYAAQGYYIPLPDNPYYEPYLMTARANADLASGTMKAYARLWGTSYAEGRAKIQDVLTFNVSPEAAGPDGFAKVTLRTTIDGVFTKTAAAGYAVGHLTTLVDQMDYTGEVPDTQGIIIGLVEGETGTNVYEEAVFEVDFFVRSGLEYFIANEFTASVLYGGEPGDFKADMLNTAIMSMILPEGVTFTSASRLFLTNPNGGDTDVPEPAMAGLFGLSLAGLGLMRGRRSAVWTAA